MHRRQRRFLNRKALFQYGRRDSKSKNGGSLGVEESVFFLNGGSPRLSFVVPLIALEKSVAESEGAVSSAVEHYTDTVGVVGSNPAPRTTLKAL